MKSKICWYVKSELPISEATEDVKLLITFLADQHVLMECALN